MPSIANCTVPPLSKVPVPGATVAVKVTDWPKFDGLSEEATDVVVVARLTVYPPLKVPVLLAKSVSPLYAAVTLYAVPLAARAESLMVALPPLSDTGEP